MVKKFYSIMNISGILTGLFFFFSSSVFSVSVASATIQVTSDRNPVSLNESFQLVYKSSDSVDGDPDFSPLEKYLEILNRSQSSNMSFINGNYTSSKTWTLSVIARQEGELLLPPIMFGSDQSSAFQVTVKKAVSQQQDQTGFYTRIRISQEQVYAQQQLVVTQQLFSDQNMSAFGMGELDFNGMDVDTQQLGEEKQYKTRIGGKAYLVIERSYAVFPQTSGLLKLSPVLAEARIGRSSNSFFDSLGRSKVVRARSNSLSIAVLPVPKNINVKPWLPAQSFQLLEQWPKNPPKFVQGEPVTRTLSIKAQGLTAAQLPVLPDISIEGLKQYPDQPMLNDIKNDTGITGYRVEKVALIPTKAGQITLPAIDIAWWNTSTQKREVAHIPARLINVEAADGHDTASMPLAPIEKKIEPEPPSSALNERSSGPRSLEESTSTKLWFVLAILFASGWLITVIAWVISLKKKNKAVSKNSTEPGINLKQAFKQLKKCCDKENAGECRSQLLVWARALFPEYNIRNLTDLMKYSGQELSGEIKKMDAALYGQQEQQIDFALIIDNANQMMHRYKNQPQRDKTDLLEPLYK